jgi:hypothetical protein
MVNNNMRTLSVFSTWHKGGYKKYGDHFIQGFLQNWPTEVRLTIYAEDHEPNTYNADNIEVLDQRSTLPDLKAWQERHKDNPHAHGWNKDKTKKSFLWDASRFANKTFALWHFAKHTEADVMIWCDGDVRTHTPMPMEFLQEIAPNEDQLTTHLGRKTWPECGWMMFNRHHPQFAEFMEQWRWIYESDDIFNHEESHDSFIFGELVQDFADAGHRDLGGPGQSGHVFINSVLGKYMDHLKGFRKEVGKSLVGDVYGNRSQHFDTNPWWQDLKHVTKSQIRQEKLKNPHEYDAEQQVKSKGIK